MSSIEKLKIVGIRSFNPHAENVIEFHTPLTIIVGHNGAGKTTIIECLKYATTGEMPPNSKGGAFVHDPKISRETDIKAQIKLKFRNTRQQAMVVTRSMQLTQTKTKTTLKTLESLLSTVDPKTGEQVSISSRCAQLDNEMPFHLGVSKAVLQNVIFCHQEESLWPLSESSVLKKRFDEIFAAERYTKALDTLRSLRKQLVQDQKVEEEKLSAFKEKRELALRLEADIRSAEERIGSTNERIRGLDAEIEASNVAIAALQRDLDRLNSLQGDYERLLQEAKMAEQSYSDLTMTVASVMDESDEELLKMLAQHEERTRGAESNMQRLTQLKSSIAEELTVSEKENGVLLSERGKLWAEHAQRERRSFDLDIALEDLCKSLGVTTSASEQDRPRTIIVASETYRALQDEFNRTQEENRGKDTVCIEQIQKLVSESNSLMEAKNSKTKLKAELSLKLELVLKELEEVEGALSVMKELEHNLKNEEQAYNRACEMNDTSDHESTMAELLEQKKALEEEQRQVNAELAALSRSAGQRARLDLKRNETVSKNQAAQKLYSDLQSDLMESLGKVPEISEVDKEAERVLRNREREVKALQERLESARGSQSAAQSKVDHISQSLNKSERDMQEKKRRADAVLGGSEWDFGSALEGAEEELAAAVNALTLSQSSKATYEDFLRSLQSTHNCPLCERGFDHESRGEAELSSKLNKFLQSLPTTVLEQEQNRRALERKVQDLRSLRPTVEDIERLRLIEIPELGRTLKQAKEDLERATLQVEDLSAELSTGQMGMTRLGQLKKKCEEVVRVHRDATICQSELSSLESECSSSGNSLSAQDLEARSAAIQTQLTLLQQEYESWQSEAKQYRARVAEAEKNYRDAKEELMKLQLRDSEYRRLDQQGVELKNSIKVLDEEINGVESSLEPMAGRIERIKADREAQRHLATEQETSLRARLDVTATLMARVSNLQAELEGSSHDEARLEQVEQQLSQLESRTAEARQKLGSIEQEIALMGREEGEVMLRGRTIKDNIALRSLSARVKDLRAKLSEMAGSVDLSMDRTGVMDNLAKRQTRHSTLLGDRAGLQGELRQLEDQAFRHRQDLSRSFPDYEVTYQTQLVRVTACAAAIDDLERYAKALDQAIMRYHGHKMDELNRLIRELWMATYQGADIDTIEIRAASEAGGGSTSSSVRTYNYRVVMIKGDSELDMRGRSSAGQRVLASLIIRLALAETFGQSCGILALDEPTTNLDKDNIEALASALADIIRVRRQQANFQLVIITHDEEFVEMLGRYECADYYYRVFKDDSQYSTIEQQAFQGALN